MSVMTQELALELRQRRPVIERLLARAAWILVGILSLSVLVMLVVVVRAARAPVHTYGAYPDGQVVLLKPFSEDDIRAGAAK